MRLKIRIYNPYDLDIIALTEVKGFSVANAMKQTLIYYANGKRYLIEIPVLTEKLEDEKKYVKGFYVELDDVTDAKAIEFIKSIPEGLRNSFMKNIFRASFEVCPLSLYMESGGPEYVAKMIANPRYGRHPVQREMIDTVHLAEGEIGVTLSETTPDVSKLPQGKKAEPVKKKTREEMLRDATQRAYNNAARKEEQQKQRQQTALHNKEESDKNASDLDALLDTMM